MSQVVGLPNNSYKPITNTACGFVNYKKRCTRLATAIDKAYQLVAHGRWFSPGTPASSASKTGRHDITEILLKVALNTNKSINQSIEEGCVSHMEQELLTIQEYLCLPSVDRVVRSVVFRVLFVLFHLSIILSVLLRFMDSDYTFGILHFLNFNVSKSINQSCVVYILNTYLLES